MGRDRVDRMERARDKAEWKLLQKVLQTPPAAIHVEGTPRTTAELLGLCGGVICSVTKRFPVALRDDLHQEIVIQLLSQQILQQFWRAVRADALPATLSGVEAALHLGITNECWLARQARPGIFPQPTSGSVGCLNARYSTDDIQVLDRCLGEKDRTRSSVPPGVAVGYLKKRLKSYIYTTAFRTASAASRKLRKPLALPGDPATVRFTTAATLSSSRIEAEIDIRLLRRKAPLDDAGWQDLSEALMRRGKGRKSDERVLTGLRKTAKAARYAG
jgi:hypothetical protein